MRVSGWRRIVTSLKFRLSLACLVLILAGTGLIVPVLLEHIGEHTEQVMLDLQSDEAAHVASVLQQRIGTLERALGAAVLNSDESTFASQAAAMHFLQIKPVLNQLFSRTFVATPQGQVLASRDDAGLQPEAFSIADREYFQRALQTRRLVVSEPVISRLGDGPSLVMAVPVFGPDEQLVGLIGASISLAAHDLGLMPRPTRERPRATDVRTLVTNQAGLILSDSHGELVLRNIAELPALAATLAQWHAAGRMIEPAPRSLRTASHIVSQAGAVELDWMVFRLADAEVLLGGLAQARTDAMRVMVLVALLGGLVMLGLLAWQLQPLEQLERRAELLLDGDQPAAGGWPQPSGEIGQLSRVLQHVLQQRERAEQHNAGLLLKMQSLLSTAPIGVVFSSRRTLDLVSKEFAALFGYTPEELQGRSASMLYASAEAYAELNRQVPKAFAQHGQFDAELHFKRRDGSLFWGRLLGRAVDPSIAAAGAIWLLHDVTRERQERENLSWSASHDALTGLCNRRAFEARLAAVLAEPRRELRAALLFLDLDRFKQVNDSAGHAAGDQVLIEVARLLQARVRGSDMVGRLGGDEFVVLLERCELAAALAVAEQVRADVQNLGFEWDGVRHEIGVSVGVAELDAEVTDLAGAFARADAACYEAKRAGRNSVRSSAGVAAALLRPGRRTAPT